MMDRFVEKNSFYKGNVLFEQKKELLLYSILSLLFGIIVHSQMIFHKYARHDEVFWLNGYPGSGAIGHGRWTYAIIKYIFDNLFGMESIAGISGVLCLILIILSAVTLAKVFGLNKKQLYIVTGIMIVFPTVSSNLGYMCTSMINFLGIFICCLAVYFVIQKKIKYFALGTILFVFALGEYQWHFAFFLSTIVFYEFFIIVNNKEEFGWKNFLYDVLYYTTSLVLGLIIYVLITKVVVLITGLSLSDYAGTSSFGIVNMHDYFIRLKSSYINFLYLDSNEWYSVFHFKWAGWFWLFVSAVVLSIIYWFIKCIKNRAIKNAIQIFIIFIIIPLAVNFMFVLYDGTRVHALHMYHYTLFFILILKTVWDVNIKYIRIIGVAFCVAFVILWWRYDDLCYSREEIIQLRTITYVNRLISRIESMDGYDVKMPILIYNEKKNTDALVDMANLMGDYEVVTPPYTANEVDEYSLIKNMEIYFGHNVQNISVIKAKGEYEDVLNEMSSYPNDDSIRIVNNVIVVKF